MTESELQLRNAEIDYHQKQQTMQRRGDALQMALNMSEGIFGPQPIAAPADEYLKIESKEIFKLANQIIKFIEKEA